MRYLFLLSRFLPQSFLYPYPYKWNHPLSLRSARAWNNTQMEILDLLRFSFFRHEDSDPDITSIITPAKLTNSYIKPWNIHLIYLQVLNYILQRGTYKKHEEFAAVLGQFNNTCILHKDLWNSAHWLWLHYIIKRTTKMQYVTDIYKYQTHICFAYLSTSLPLPPHHTQLTACAYTHTCTYMHTHTHTHTHTLSRGHKSRTHLTQRFHPHRQRQCDSCPLWPSSAGIGPLCCDTRSPGRSQTQAALKHSQHQRQQHHAHVTSNIVFDKTANPPPPCSW